MRVFLDFEASSLSDDSYPIEVAWVFEDGAPEAYLIRPAPGWTDWDVGAQVIHRIGRGELEAQGQPVETVARRMMDVLAGHDLFVSAPSWDGKWLSVLLRAAGLPRHALRLRDTDTAMVESIHAALAGFAPAAVQATTRAVLTEARRWKARQPVRHRALADAELERQTWLLAGRLAAERAAPSSGPGAGA